jgi:hypothetical protein
MIHHTSHPVGYCNQIRSGLSLSPKPALPSFPTQCTHFIHAPGAGVGVSSCSVSQGRDSRVLLGGQRGEMDRGVWSSFAGFWEARIPAAGMRKRAGGEGWGIFSLCKKKWGC